MPRAKTQPENLTVGQLAKRWSVSTSRVQSLIQAGLLPGVFEIPSVGRFGATTKIPLASIRQVEMDWSIVPIDLVEKKRKPPRSRGGSLPALKHFPELEFSPECDAECRVNGSR